MRLRYQRIDNPEHLVELSERPLVIGRGEDADVLVLDVEASRQHCSIRFSEGRFYILDLNSKNGTFVNSKKVDLFQLRSGDQIRVGSTTLFFEHSDTRKVNVFSNKTKPTKKSSTKRKIITKKKASTSKRIVIKKRTKQLKIHKHPTK